MEFLSARQKRIYASMERTPLGTALLTDWFLLTRRQKIAYYRPRIDAAIKNHSPQADRPGESDAMARQRRQIVFAMFVYGILPDEYYMFRFADLSPLGRSHFITDKITVANLHKLNDYAYLDLFNNKYKTYQRYGQFYGRQLLRLTGPQDRETFMAFAAANKVFVCKGETGSCGRNVSRIDTAAYPSLADLFEKLSGQAAGTPLVLEPLIRQSAVMSRLNASSVNTVRLLTLLGDDGQVIYKYPFLKIGRGGAFVDNGGQGGLLALIDEATGVITTPGCTEDGARFMRHPDSGTVIPGYVLPDWPQALQLGRRLAAITPRVRYIGWDLAHTDDGWVVVEGNFASMFVGQQICDMIGKREEFCAIVDGLSELPPAARS